MTDKSTDRPTCKPGDIVNVAIEGVRMGERSHIRVTIEDERGELWVLPPQAEITLVASAEWPPRPGDLWRDSRDGGLWFGMEPPAGGVILNGYDGGRHGPEYVNRERGPLTLVHREDGSDA